MMHEIMKKSEKEMLEAMQQLEKELRAIRSNRANPAILDEVRVEVYGTMMSLKDIANITTPEARQILITPYDPQNNSAIGKAIEKANLNINPIVDANAVRINIPPMDKQQREDRAKLAKKKGEESKVRVRNIRRDANDTAKKNKNGALAEDEVNKIQKKIQEMTDLYCTKIDTYVQNKEKEILEI